MTPKNPTPSQHQLRAELETMVLGDLLGPAGGEGEELTERTVRDRYIFPPKLVASGVDGEAVFCKRTMLGMNNDPEERLAELAA